jgi:hypothetical protein
MVGDSRVSAQQWLVFMGDLYKVPFYPKGVCFDDFISPPLLTLKLFSLSPSPMILA